MASATASVTSTPINRVGSLLMTAGHRGLMTTQELEEIGAILDAGADVNTCHHNGISALTYAAQLWDPALTRCLLAHGADPQDWRVNGPVHVAAIHHHVLHIPLLHAAGANASKPNDLGETPLELCFRTRVKPRDRDRTLLALLQAGASPTDLTQVDHLDILGATIADAAIARPRLRGLLADRLTDALVAGGIHAAWAAPHLARLGSRS